MINHGFIALLAAKLKKQKSMQDTTHKVDYEFLFERVVLRNGQYIISRKSLREYKKQYGNVEQRLFDRGILVLPISDNLFRIKKAY